MSNAQANRLYEQACLLHVVLMARLGNEREGSARRERVLDLVVRAGKRANRRQRVATRAFMAAGRSGRLPRQQRGQA